MRLNLGNRLSIRTPGPVLDNFRYMLSAGVRCVISDQCSSRLGWSLWDSFLVSLGFSIREDHLRERL